MGDLTQLERIINLEAAVRVLTEELARVKCEKNAGVEVDFPNGGWVCEVCGQSCRSALGLSSHMRKHGKRYG